MDFQSRGEMNLGMLFCFYIKLVSFMKKSQEVLEKAATLKRNESSLVPGSLKQGTGVISALNILFMIKMRMLLDIVCMDLLLYVRKIYIAMYSPERPKIKGEH